jgi:outer membrane protein assembly factor BamB
MSVVRGGKVVWTYSIPGKSAAGHAQEITDAWMLSNGNILFSRETGAMELTPAKQVVWNYDAPAGCEVHVAQPVGKDRVFILQNGTPALAMIINTTTGNVEKRTVILAPPQPHSQFRHARLTAANTILVAHLNEGRVAEYDWSGNEIWSVPAPSVWAATRLKNGNTLISLEHSGMREVNPKGETVWEFTQADVPDIKLVSMQEASRLANGNTLICNWASGRVPLTEWPKEVQLLEVTPQKKVVWAVRSWAGDADLGPATSVQLLDEPGLPENPGDLQR